jgi:hypothetical protein
MVGQAVGKMFPLQQICILYMFTLTARAPPADTSRVSSVAKETSYVTSRKVGVAAVPVISGPES